MRSDDVIEPWVIESRVDDVIGGSCVRRTLGGEFRFRRMTSSSELRVSPLVIVGIARGSMCPFSCLLLEDARCPRPNESESVLGSESECPFDEPL
jgi:hypothetical protein